MSGVDWSLDRLFDLVVIVAACWRLTILVTGDTITAPMRLWVADKADHATTQPRRRVAGFVSDLIGTLHTVNTATPPEVNMQPAGVQGCGWCVPVWIVTPVAVCWWLWPTLTVQVMLIPALWMAVSTAWQRWSVE